MGVLVGWYRAADAAFVGGSLVAVRRAQPARAGGVRRGGAHGAVPRLAGDVRARAARRRGGIAIAAAGEPLAAALRELLEDDGAARARAAGGAGGGARRSAARRRRAVARARGVGTVAGVSGAGWRAPRAALYALGVGARAARAYARGWRTPARVLRARREHRQPERRGRRQDDARAAPGRARARARRRGGDRLPALPPGPGRRGRRGAAVPCRGRGGALLRRPAQARDSARAAAAAGAALVLVDDGFSHWPLARDVDVVLLDATRPLGRRRAAARWGGCASRCGRCSARTRSWSRAWRRARIPRRWLASRAAVRAGGGCSRPRATAVAGVRDAAAAGCTRRAARRAS